MLVDTHCHLADPAFDGDRQAVLARARAAGVSHVVAIGESPDRARAALALARAHAGISATAGLHPHEAHAWTDDTARWLDAALEDAAVVAAGETGLDYHYEFSPRDRQREAFEAQLELAGRHAKPAVVHARKADEDVAAALRNHPGTTAILHSFSSGPGLLRVAVALGHYVSWSGMLTFRTWANVELVREVPRDRLLVETDAPYLAPVPFRGRRNEPAFVTHTAARLARVLDLSPDELMALTTANAIRAFGPRIASSALEAL